MFELEVKHKRGKKSFAYILINYGWWLMLIGAGFLYLSWASTFGPLNIPAASLFADHPDWYMDTSMLSWFALLFAFAFILFAVLRANIHYRKYKFILDEYAVHLHRGLFFIRETTIPYNQISNVHIDRPLSYRLFGVAELDIVTAADKSMEVIDKQTKKFFIPIIDLSIARRLSRQLLESAHKIRMEERTGGDQDEIIYEVLENQASK